MTDSSLSGRTRVWARSVILGALALGILAATAEAAAPAGGKAGAYYTVLPLFSQHPDEGKPTQSIDRFGPVGIGIELRQPAFRMRVRNVEAGSPAAATGKLKPGQWIDSINGRVLKDIDPRLILGDIIATAEATDGVVRLMVRDEEKAPAQEVAVNIPVLGAHSETWPLNCPKSDKIVRGLAEYLKKSGAWGMGFRTLFLLSTGDEDDLAYVRRSMQGMATKNKDKKTLDLYPWYIGYSGPAICEYYLRTGDGGVLHTIKLYADHLRDTMYNDAWGGKGIGSYHYMAGGHMNAAGVHCLTFLLLAKECGVDVDEVTLQRSLRHFFRFAGRGNVSYGDGLPEYSFVDNGKTGGLAFAMAAAASLTPDGEKSVYAKARDISGFKSYYSTSWLLHGHTGGGIGEIWRGGAMGLLHETKPEKYRQFMNHRAWFYDLSRRFDGSFGILGGGRYDKPDSWGVGMGMVYTIPRKTLRMTGAPRSKFSHPYRLPERPWGTAADDMFYSMEAAAVPGQEPQDVDAEVFEKDTPRAMLPRLRAEDLSDATILKYTHHPELGLREYAAKRVVGRNRPELAVQMLKSEDPRVRHAGMLSLKEVTPEVAELLIGMVVDPDESWWVAMSAMDRLGSVDPELLVPHVDRLTYWLKHDDWWVRKSAMTALTQLAADKRYCRDILPVIGDMVVNNTHAVALSPLGGIVRQLEKAEPQVQAYAVEVLGEAYAAFPRMIRNPAGNEVPTATPYLLGGLARNLAGLPGGFDGLYQVSRERFPGQALPHRDLYLRADASRFGPVVGEALRPVVLDYLVPQYMAANRSRLLSVANHGKFRPAYNIHTPRMEELVDLYNRVGIHDYDWKDCGPKIEEMAWDYYTFDPPEKKLPGTGTRYREVTLPEGMEDWYTVEFDAKQAGWKSGLQPFGQDNGRLVTNRKKCRFDFCRCETPVKTLWDKEVLLMRGRFKFPKFREGYNYRLLIGGVSHVNTGEGFRLYINGKQFAERKGGTPRRGGGRPIGSHVIEKKWWPEFDGQETTLAVTSFLRIGTNSKENRIFVWLQEMKNPPMDEELFARGRRFQPMRCTAWQASKSDADKYNYNGEFVANKAIQGNWVQVAKVRNIEDFEPANAASPDPESPLQSIQLRDGGKTDKDGMVWSDDILMDLKTLSALQMSPETIDGVEYLFIEAGGFSKPVRNGWSPNHPEDWTPELYVFRKHPNA